MPVVDLRSDTVTRPSAAMRRAIAEAEVGDDVFGDDPTVQRLESAVASTLGKQRGLFVPSGTMANQLAVRAQTQPGDEVIVHGRSHIYNYESGATAALSGVQIRAVESDDGSLPPDVVRAALRGAHDVHFAPTRLLCAENTHNGCGGTAVSVEATAAALDVARGAGLRTHLDGARLFNAAAALGVPVSALAAGFDTVSVCLSKGLGAPVGSVLAGDDHTIQRARRFRKMFGGGMRQAGVLAAAGLHALEHHVERLADDHRRARRLAAALDALPGVTCAAPATNLVYFALDAASPLAARTADGTARLVADLASLGVLIVGAGERYRAVTHLDVDDAGVDRAIEVLQSVFRAAV